MSQKALKVVVELHVRAIFKYANDPAAIAEILQCTQSDVTSYTLLYKRRSCETVKIDLIQLIPPAGEVLASYEENARSFLFPEPKLVPSFCGGDRKVLMTRDPAFPGISPRLEFSTRTTISECTERDLFQSVPVRVMTRKRGRKVRHQSRTSAARKSPQTPRHRSLSPFKRSESSRTSSSSDTAHRHLPNESSSSDTDDLLDDAKELGQQPPLVGYEGSPSPAPLSHCTMASPRQNSSLLCSPNVWEEVQERVRSLLTSPRAVHRLTYGATESEIDEVLARRSISPHT
ncbi:hypothetical protein NFI96_023892 [Prochilodus magdalenae]|nr:hypothetical protein NFI96_023892 [Prochilodus magdalenae]